MVGVGLSPVAPGWTVEPGGRQASRDGFAVSFLSVRCSSEEGGERRVGMADAQHVPQDGRLGVEVCNAVVRTLSEYTGRGATRSRAHVGEDLITVVLEDTLTRGEQTLVDHGQGELVLATRRQYQAAMRRDLVTEVERLTGRTVRAFLSENHLGPDLAVEVFVMTPVPA
jgi:uncharacterized protein YbcI